MTAPRDLAHQLVEHPRWAWQPGMAASWFQDHMIGTFLAFVTEANPDRVHIVTDRDRLFSLHPSDADLTPALEHPATRGWLLHMLREAHKFESLTPATHKFCNRLPHRAWDVDVYDETFTAATEGAALAAALLAAWGGVA